MGKKAFLFFVIAVILVITGVYLYRHTIIQYYAEKIIRENLPEYIKIEKIGFDFTMSKISFGNFKVLNPPGFFSDYLLKINSISCKYRVRGGVIPEGIEISDVVFKGSDIEIERLKNGTFNAVEMGGFIKDSSPREKQIPPSDREAGTDSGEESKPKAENRSIAGKKISDIIKLPVSVRIKDSRIAFLDRLPYDKPHLITVDSVSGDISIRFDDNYSGILALDFKLEGNLNDSRSETIRWVGSLDPTKPRLTMSNRFEVSGLDLLVFEPYYEESSPFVFTRGRFSGTLIFDFDNGNIGSTNEIHLSGLEFFVKPGYENSQMWETNVQDLMSYFTTTSGDVVFDFKLKGDMSNPQFYLGPISKRALTSMAINKVASYAVNQVTKQGDNASQTVDKAREYIDLFQNLLKKK